MADAQEHTIEQQVLDSANAIRLKISHVYYVIVSIFVLPALVASLSRLSEIDFLPIMGLQLASVHYYLDHCPPAKKDSLYSTLAVSHHH